MIWRLLLRDRYWWVGWFISLSVTVMCVLNRYALGSSARIPSEHLTWIAVSMIGWTCALLVDRRVDIHYSALPISARDISVAQGISTLAPIWLTAVFISIAATVGLIEGSVANAMEAAALWTVPVLIALAVRPLDRAGSRWLIWLLPTLAAGLTLLWFAPQDLTWRVRLGILMILLLQAALSPPKTSKVAGGPTASLVLPGAASPLRQSVYNKLFPLYGILTVIALLDPIYCAIFTVIILNAARLSNWLAALPVSRRRIVALVVLPALALAAAGHLLSSRFLPRIPLPARHAEAQDTPRIPLTFWTLSFGAAPEIRAPWGEQCRPETAGAFIALYNPYSICPASSLRFVEWQSERTAREVYGNHLRPITRQFRGEAIALLVTLGCMLLWPALSLLTGWRRLSGIGKRWLSPVDLLMVLGMLGYMMFGLLHAIFVLPSARPFSLTDFLALRLGRFLPENPAILIVCALLLLLALYRLVEKEFEESDSLRPGVPAGTGMWNA